MPAQLTRARRVRTPKRSILARITKPSREACWLWTGARNSKGYPAVRIRSAYVLVHRFMLAQFLGRELRPNHDAHHLRDIYGCPEHCVNPLHLQELHALFHRKRHLASRKCNHNQYTKSYEKREQFRKRVSKKRNAAA